MHIPTNAFILGVGLGLVICGVFGVISWPLVVWVGFAFGLWAGTKLARRGITF